MSDTMNSGHTVEIQERVMLPDDGLVLGNGDLSVSVYQANHAIVFRLGKNDVWDRRLDMSDDPEPLHIDELARGIRDEGWRCGPYGGPVEAIYGTRDAERMQEVCQGSPPSYRNRPFPCPKPTGEMALHLPPDLTGLKITQRLHIEKARIEIECSWDNGVRLEVEAFIPPRPNVLIVHWDLEGWGEETQIGLNGPPVWFSLYRWADPEIGAFAAGLEAENMATGLQGYAHPNATPLPPPISGCEQDRCFVEQAFPPDLTFPEGFRYRMIPLSADLKARILARDAIQEACLRLDPKDGDRPEGGLAVHVATDSDEGGAVEEMRRVAGGFEHDPSGTFEVWGEANRERAAAFWSRSGLRLADSFLENLWYETLHARRCHYRGDTVPPGLYLPSSLRDYTAWHGDYHWNYNFQSPFWGDHAANHVEDLADAYCRAMEYMLRLGRKIARDYYGCRGAFIQLTGYPMEAPDDWLGIAPMGRMAYMTGWAANYYWWRYLYTMDEDWLADEGYPVLRDCALFYTDFLTKGDDGLYHAFPSNQSEDGFTGDPKAYTDRPQIMRHMRYCLRAAIAAADVLGLDEDLQAEWRDRVAHAAPDDGRSGPELPGVDRSMVERYPPEFYAPDGSMPPEIEPDGPSPWADPEHFLRTWYCGKLPEYWLIDLRNEVFVPERDLAHVCDIIRRWRRPNGLLCAMARAQYGTLGAWTETLGIIAPIQEMLLQSWKGFIEVFPAWPHDASASFRSLRAEGAFLVSARLAEGDVQRVEIRSERGVRCRVRDPWPQGVIVKDQQGDCLEAVSCDGITAFETIPGGVYELCSR